MSDYNVKLGETDWRALADDLADVLDSVNLHKAPEVRRVLARYREARNQGEPT